MKLLLGGSPCTYWSIAQTKNRETEASGMGWELFKNYCIARDKFAPDYFLYENNKSMSALIREQITRELGVEPVCINSALVSAQNRQRLYWCGKRNPDGTYSTVNIGQPEDRGILLRDILESGACWREKGYALLSSTGGTTAEDMIARKQRNGAAEPVKTSAEVLNVNPCGHGMNGAVIHVNGKSRTLTTNKGEGPKIIEPVIVNPLPSGKSRTIDAHMGKLEGNLVPRMNDPKPNKQQYDCVVEPIDCAAMRQVGRRINDEGHRDDYNPLLKHEQRFEVNDDPQKTNCLSTVQKDNMVAEPIRVGTIDQPIYRVENGFITIKGKQYPIKLRDGCYIIRKLTVTECKRLQTVPDTYEFPVSNNQAYKMLGNGWTVEVIAHILSCFDGITDEPIDVLSMYDGMSCGHIALDRIGANVRRYLATEIDQHAIKTTQHNYPETIQLGDAFQVREADWRLPI